MSDLIEYQSIQPTDDLSSIVESFWMLRNHTSEQRDITVLPDGRVDISFSFFSTETFEVRLMGFGTHADAASIPPHLTIIAVSLKLLAIEYFLKESVADILDGSRPITNNYFDLELDDLKDLKRFAKKISISIRERLLKDFDARKEKAFNQIHQSEGEINVRELAGNVGWSSRQMNRYFNSWFGLSLKAYCSILRFRASFKQIKAGKFFPENSFSDQAHFVREIKRFSGVTPKVLSKNQNDRFIQFSTLTDK